MRIVSAAIRRFASMNNRKDELFQQVLWRIIYAIKSFAYCNHPMQSLGWPLRDSY